MSMLRDAGAHIVYRGYALNYGNPFAHLFTRAPALHKCDRECAKWPFDPTTALPQPQKYLSILYCAYI